MNRETLINDVAAGTGVPKRRVSAVLKEFLSEITEALSQDERVELRQFGSFEVKIRKARMARDLHTNAEMPLRDRPMPHFVPFDHLKNTVSEQPVSHAKSTEKDSVPMQSENPDQTREENTAPMRSNSPDMTSEKVSVPTQPENPARTGDEVSASTQVNTEVKPEDGSNEIAAMLSRAETLASRGKFEQAIKQYRRVLERNPRHTTATGRIGKMHFNLGSHETAMQYYNQVLGNDPSHLDTLVDRAELYASMGHYEEAKTDLLHALEYEPYCYAACFRLGVLYITTGAYESSIKILTRALDTGQVQPEVYFQLGKACCHMERNDEAIQHFETLLSQQPDNRQAYRYLGMIYDKSRQIDRALEMYRKSNEIGME